MNVAGHMFCACDAPHCRGAHSSSLNAFMQESKPQQNLSVCHRTNYKYIGSMKGPSVSVSTTAVCVLHSGCGRNTPWNRCLIDLLQPEKVSCVISVWLHSVCALLSLPPRLRGISFPSVFGLSYLCSFRWQQHVFLGDKNIVSLSGLLFPHEGHLESTEVRWSGWILPVPVGVCTFSISSCAAEQSKNCKHSAQFPWARLELTTNMRQNPLSKSVGIVYNCEF